MGNKIYVGNGVNKANAVKSGYVGVKDTSRQFWPNEYQKQTFTISSNQAALELRVWLINNGWDEISPVEVTVAAGVLIYSRHTNENAMVIREGFPNGIRLINRGTISGFGGRGGNGGNAGTGAWRVCGPGQPGANGGNALYVRTDVTILNEGYIAGGGGGGGGGAAAYGEQGSGYTESGGGSGGGGYPSGSPGVPVGANGNSSNHYWRVGNYGAAAPALYHGNAAGGVGGTGGDRNSNTGGTGGTGGSWGVAGGAGTVGPNSWVEDYLTGQPGVGGAGGRAIVTIANITWEQKGQIYGDIIQAA